MLEKEIVYFSYMHTVYRSRVVQMYTVYHGLKFTFTDVQIYCFVLSE